jgi:hypothetical protein
MKKKDLPIFGICKLELQQLLNNTIAFLEKNHCCLYGKTRSRTQIKGTFNWKRKREEDCNSTANDSLREKRLCNTSLFIDFLCLVAFRRFEYLNSDEATLAHKKYIFNINF